MCQGKRKIIVAKNCGFCIGVQSAVSLVEKALTNYSNVGVYSLGMFIHNELEVQRLVKKGLKLVNAVDDIPENSVLLLPSHGTPPNIRELCRAKNIKTIDLMCVYVKKLQDIVVSHFKKNFAIIMLGDKNHPEIAAVSSLCNRVIVIDKTDILNDNLNLNFDRYVIVSQTTQAISLYKEIVVALMSKVFPAKEVRVYNTICWDVMERQREARQMSEFCDVVFVLGGKKSANSRRLFEIVQKKVDSYFISKLSDFDLGMIKNKNTIGVLSGTSTPDWFVEKFCEKLKKEAGVNGE